MGEDALRKSSSVSDPWADRLSVFIHGSKCAFGKMDHCRICNLSNIGFDYIDLCGNRSSAQKEIAFVCLSKRKKEKKSYENMEEMVSSGSA